MNISVIILAGGAGSRMKSSIPKVLHRICGKEMLFFTIDEALKLSKDVHIVLYHNADVIQKRILKAYPKHKLSFHIQDYANYPGTAGALMQGAESSQNAKNAKMPFSTKYKELLILNGDMPLVSAKTLEQLCAKKAKIIMSILHLDNPNGYGRVVLKGGKVEQIIEQKDATNAQLSIKDVNAGVYKIDRALLESYLPTLTNDNKQGEFYLTDVIYKARRDNIDIEALSVEESEFIGVNDKVALAQAESIKLEALRNAAMEQGVIMHLPHTIYIESSVIFEGECEIEQGVQIKGNSVIKSSHIKAHSVIEDSTIDSSDIGPLAHIRPNSTISHSHIGNFVEVKSSVLDNVKAGHLSYLGDCEIGSGTNVGAGVITCNYDGKKKHKTIIGKDVFIGSDTQLVAPLKIESSVLIGAGSTITKNVAKGELVLSRVSQKHIKNGYFTFFKKP